MLVIRLPSISSIKIWQILKCPNLAARWNGVIPFFPEGFLSTTLSKMNLELSKFPREAARCRGVVKIPVSEVNVGLISPILYATYFNDSNCPNKATRKV